MYYKLQQNVQGIRNDAELYFHLISEIGNGSFGKNYKALNMINDQLVSIKMLSIEEDIREAHIQDIQILQYLNHKNITKIIDVYFSKNKKNIWIIQEYCEFGSIGEILQNTGLVFTESEIACIVDQILSALIFCHEQDVIHRDLRTGSILINKQGDIKIQDFGLSTLKRDLYSYVGSPIYMSPEQLKSSTYNSKIDIWSLGITLIEMAELYPPFSNISKQKIQDIIQQNPIIQLSQQQDFTPQFIDFIQQCLQIDPEKRWSAEQLLQHQFLQIHKQNITNVNFHRQYFSYMKHNIIDVRKKSIEKYKTNNIIQPPQISQLSNFQQENGSSISDMSRIQTIFQQNTIYSDMSEFMWMENLKNSNQNNINIKLIGNFDGKLKKYTQIYQGNINKKTFKSQKLNESSSNFMCDDSLKSQKQKNFSQAHQARERANSQILFTQALSGKSGSSSGQSDIQYKRSQKYKKNQQQQNKVCLTQKNIQNESFDNSNIDVMQSNIMTESNGPKHIHIFDNKQMQPNIPKISISPRSSIEKLIFNKSKELQIEENYEFPPRQFTIRPQLCDTNMRQQLQQKCLNIQNNFDVLQPVPSEKTLDYSTNQQSQISHKDINLQRLCSENFSSRKQSEKSIRKTSDSPQFKTLGNEPSGESPCFKLPLNLDLINSPDKSRLFSFNSTSKSKKKNPIFQQFTPAQEKLKSHRNYFSINPTQKWQDMQLEILTRKTESSQNSPEFRQRQYSINQL